MKALYLILSVLPKNLISYVVGVLVRIELPSPLAKIVHRWFIKAFSINIDEAEFPLDHYKSIEAVFTRKLKPEARKIAKESYVSPCDSLLTCNEKVKNKLKPFTIKGVLYNPSELTDETNINPSWISVFYLAPHNYHRVHSPLDGTVLWVKHIPGNLWPVKPAFLKFLPDLFNKNERLVFKMAPSTGGTAYLIMVGALNVGRMVTPLSDKIITNNSHFSKTTKEHLTPPVFLKKGDEIGTFMMGSTVVVLLDDLASQGLKEQLSEQQVGLPLKVGEPLI